jgi:hypothetical protein
MNKTVPFGLHHIAGYSIFKLNMNLTSEDAQAIRDTFGFDVVRIYSKPQLHRIEGALSWKQRGYGDLIQKFWNTKELYQTNAKMEKLANKKALLLDKAIGAENLLADLDLPF